jgi:acetylornithine deacetylase/succinyl-diaminopimelate desuccinylase-like protein
MEVKEINWDKVKDEATRILSHYIKLNTINPPGNEIQGAIFLKKILDEEGIKSDIIESEKGRGNLIARIKGTEDKPALLLLHHIDVVPAEEEKWKYPPLSGKVINGEIWGRGALDCKSLGVMELLTVIILKRIGFQPKRDIILAATADEETGGEYGVSWLLKEYPHLIDAKYVINEGGGIGFERSDTHLYFCQTAEKGVCWLRFVFQGESGHASLPHGNNCISEMSKAITIISELSFPFRVTSVSERFIKEIAQEQDFMPSPKFLKLLDPQSFSDIIEEFSDPSLKVILPSMFYNTIVPTVIRGGKKTNVLPSECYFEVDARILPGERPEDTINLIKDLLKDISDFQVEVLSSSAASESLVDSEILTCIERSFKKHDHRAKLIPYMSSGASDSRFFRKLGAIAYGVQMEASFKTLSSIHSHNEKISSNTLLFGIKVLYDAVRMFSS